MSERAGFASIASVGRGGLRLLAGTGILALVLARTVYRLPRLDRRELLRGLAHFGYGSLPVTLVVAVVGGATVVIQTSLYTERFGARGYLGWAAGYAILWEFGPLLLGLLLAARVGARNAAELATLNVGGQLEGLRGISLDPFALLIAPRLLAMTLSATLLSALAGVVAVSVEAVAAYFTLGLPVRVFASSFAQLLSIDDAAAGLTKSAVFGLAVAVVSTAVGLRARGGARGVGQAAASAVVRGCAAIFVLDFALTHLLARVL
jgi:phospholipid/cholesterol/gamma-HCH transport system permease protein